MCNVETPLLLASRNAIITPKPTLILRHEYDVAYFRAKAKNMDNSQILVLIQNVFKPDKCFTFPKTNGRSFLYKCFDNYSWLCYSPSLDGALCLPCVLFGDQFPSKANRIKILFSEPMSHWSDACASFKRHVGLGTKAVSKSGLHESTSSLFTNIIAQASGKAQPIEVMVDEHAKKTIFENRKKLVPIVDTIKLCGRLGLPLRGHRDDSKYHPEVGSYSQGGVGNFVELLNFRVRGGDTLLQEHLKNCPKNASYISKTTQNDLIKSCGQVITDKIVDEVKRNKFFTIIADEAADSSNKEQMSLVLRFVDDNRNIREDFVRFLHCKWGLCGADLAKLILNALTDLSLNINDCRGQGYDGAVAGHINGLSAHILRLNRKAIYTHCYSHRLNLAICDSCSVPLVRNAFMQIKELSYFFNLSDGRQMLLEKNVLKYCPDSNKMKLKDVCRTRWIERVNGMDIFQELFVPIFFTLSEMSLNAERVCNPATSSKATSFLALISSFQFIVALVISRNVLDLTLPVTQLLQAKINDVMVGMHLIDALKGLGIRVRDQIDFYHDTWYSQAVALADKVDVDERMPRTASKQTTRDNHPASDASEYYKRVITIPLIDHLNSDLKTRFDFSNVNAYYGLSVVPSKIISLLDTSKSDVQSWKEKFKIFTNFYEDDLPNPLALDAELELWQKYWETYKGSRPDSAASTLKVLNFDGFENIKIALRILATLPVTSCECERSISALRMLKTYNRSTMVEDRLNGLALMQIH